MEKPIEDYQQPKITGRPQKIILNEKETAETDELDPKFQNQGSEENKEEKQANEPGDDPKTRLI